MSDGTYVTNNNLETDSGFAGSHLGRLFSASNLNAESKNQRLHDAETLQTNVTIVFRNNFSTETLYKLPGTLKKDKWHVRGACR